MAGVWVWIIFFALCLVGMFVIGKVFVQPKGRLFLAHAALGICSLLIAQALLPTVRLNLVTLAASTVLGVPGTILVLVIGLL